MITSYITFKLASIFLFIVTARVITSTAPRRKLSFVMSVLVVADIVTLFIYYTGIVLWGDVVPFNDSTQVVPVVGIIKLVVMSVSVKGFCR